MSSERWMSGTLPETACPEVPGRLALGQPTRRASHITQEVRDVSDFHWEEDGD